MAKKNFFNWITRSTFFSTCSPHIVCEPNHRTLQSASHIPKRGCEWRTGGTGFSTRLIMMIWWWRLVWSGWWVRWLVIGMRTKSNIRWNEKARHAALLIILWAGKEWGRWIWGWNKILYELSFECERMWTLLKSACRSLTLPDSLHLFTCKVVRNPRSRGWVKELQIQMKIHF